MLAWVRKLQKNWLARVFIGLVVVVLVFWGVSNVVTLIGSNTAVAHVGGQAVDISTVQGQYQTALNQATSAGGPQPDLNARHQMAAEALASVVQQTELRQEEAKLGISAPDSAIREAIHAIPGFQTNGVFDQTKFNQVLQQNNTSPDQFIGEVKDDLARRQLIDAVLSGAAAPNELLTQLFDYLAQQRFVEMVQIPLAAQPAPKPPADAVLQRYWRNHPADFTAPEFREIKLVILSPALLAPKEEVAQSVIDADYARVQAAQPSLPLRSVQVLVVGDLAASSRLQAAWQGGASWTKMQALAKKFGANAVELDNAKQLQIPSPALGQAVFAATPGVVTGPIAGPVAMFVFKVTNVSSSGPDAAAVKAQIKQQLQLEKAQADVAQDVDNLQDALAGQTPLDQLPGNLGLVPLEGTLDANGNAQDGTPAPIPGGADLKAAVVKAAFAAHVNDPAQLMNGPGGSYFALTVNAITPPELQPYDQVRGKVLSAWTAAQIRRAAEAKAAALLAAVNGGQSFDAAASAAGYGVTMSPPVTRGTPPAGMNAGMVAVIFSLKLNQAAMVERDTGFTVAGLSRVTQVSAAQDPADYAQLQQAMTKALQNDAGESFLAGLQARDHVTIDQKLLAQIYQ
jgi:peptidyl-prolyl cis-trans isomerase D